MELSDVNKSLDRILHACREQVTDTFESDYDMRIEFHINTIIGRSANAYQSAINGLHVLHYTAETGSEKEENLYKRIDEMVSYYPEYEKNLSELVNALPEMQVKSGKSNQYENPFASIQNAFDDLDSEKQYNTAVDNLMSSIDGFNDKISPFTIGYTGMKSDLIYFGEMLEGITPKPTFDWNQMFGVNIGLQYGEKAHLQYVHKTTGESVFDAEYENGQLVNKRGRFEYEDSALESFDAYLQKIESEEVNDIELVRSYDGFTFVQLNGVWTDGDMEFAEKPSGLTAMCTDGILGRDEDGIPYIHANGKALSIGDAYEQNVKYIAKESNELTGLMQTAGAIGETMGSHSKYEEFYKNNGEDLGGFPGIWWLYGDMALAMESTVNQNGGYEKIEFIEMIDKYCDNVMNQFEDKTIQEIAEYTVNSFIESEEESEGLGV